MQFTYCSYVNKAAWFKSSILLRKEDTQTLLTFFPKMTDKSRFACLRLRLHLRWQCSHVKQEQMLAQARCKISIPPCACVCVCVVLVFKCFSLHLRLRSFSSHRSCEPAFIVCTGRCLYLRFCIMSKFWQLFAGHTW